MEYKLRSPRSALGKGVAQCVTEADNRLDYRKFPTQPRKVLIKALWKCDGKIVDAAGGKCKAVSIWQ